MPVVLDHVTVAARDRVAAARMLAGVLGVPWDADGAVGSYSPVYVSEDLTLDFSQTDEPIVKQHLCFRTTQSEFDAIVQRMRDTGVSFRSMSHGPDDCQIARVYDGQRIYWNMPEGHVWELLTVSYKRQSSVDRR